MLDNNKPGPAFLPCAYRKSLIAQGLYNTFQMVGHVRSFIKKRMRDETTECTEKYSVFSKRTSVKRNNGKKDSFKRTQRGRPVKSLQHFEF